MKNYLPHYLLTSRISMMLLMSLGLLLSSSAKAEVVDLPLVATHVIDPKTSPVIELPSSGQQINSFGSFVIKDGVLDDIHNFKFVLINAQLKSLLAKQLGTTDSISFEQTHVMVLPMMGMVHFIGKLTIGEVSNRADFQLGFTVNEDESVTFKGVKMLQMRDYAKDQVQKDLSLDINFVLKNNENIVAK